MRIRLARLLRLLAGLADRLDPPPVAPAEDVRLVSREELRAIQDELLQMIENWIYVARIDGRGADGLLWIPREVLETIRYFLGEEINARDRDFEAVETNPATVLR